MKNYNQNQINVIKYIAKNLSIIIANAAKSNVFEYHENLPSNESNLNYIQQLKDFEEPNNLVKLERFWVIPNDTIIFTQNLKTELCSKKINFINKKCNNLDKIDIMKLLKYKTKIDLPFKKLDIVDIRYDLPEVVKKVYAQPLYILSNLKTLKFEKHKNIEDFETFIHNFKEPNSKSVYDNISNINFEDNFFLKKNSIELKTWHQEITKSEELIKIFDINYKHLNYLDIRKKIEKTLIDQNIENLIKSSKMIIDNKIEVEFDEVKKEEYFKIYKNLDLLKNMKEPLTYFKIIENINLATASLKYIVEIEGQENTSLIPIVDTISLHHSIF